MKSITFVYSNGTSMTLTDDDNSDLDEYTKIATQCMKASNVSTISTSSGNLSVRPSRLDAILVESIVEEEEEIQEIDGQLEIKNEQEIEDTLQKLEEETIKDEESDKTPEKVTEEQEDIILDED